MKNTIFILLSMVFFISCSDDFKEVVSLTYDGKFPDESATDIELVMSEEGEKSFFLYAPILNKYTTVEEPFMDCPKGVKIISYGSFGEEQSVLTADYAISIDNSGLMEARYNVVIRDLQKNETIETEKIVWDKKSKRIFSDVEIRQIKADSTVNIGDGFDADEKFTKYSIRNPRGEVVSEDLQ